jgi:hypothetical protein
MVIDKIFTFLDRNMHHVSYKFPGGNDMKTMPHEKQEISTLQIKKSWNKMKTSLNDRKTSRKGLKIVNKGQYSKDKTRTKKQKIHTCKCYENKYPLAQYSFENTLSSILQIAFLGT